MRRPIAVLVLLSLAGCGAPRASLRQCPESRALRCVTQPVCDYDVERGCEVCACGEPIAPFEREPAESEPPAPRRP